MTNQTEQLARALCDAESDNMRSARCQEDGWCGSPRCQMGKLVPQLLACLQEQGLAIVPLEPTRKMLEAGESAVEDSEDSTKDTEGWHTWIDHASAALGAYKAMLAARDEG